MKHEDDESQELSENMRGTIKEAADAADIFSDDEDEHGACLNEELLNTEEAAFIIGCSKASVNGWISKQIMPAQRIGRSISIRRSIVDAVRDLRSQYGSDWPAMAPWNQIPADEESAEAEPATLASKMKARALELKAEGKMSEALELMTVLLEHFSFDEAESE